VTQHPLYNSLVWDSCSRNVFSSEINDIVACVPIEELLTVLKSCNFLCLRQTVYSLFFCMRLQLQIFTDNSMECCKWYLKLLGQFTYWLALVSSKTFLCSYSAFVVTFWFISTSFGHSTCTLINLTPTTKWFERPKDLNVLFVLFGLRLFLSCLMFSP
jgi:hypothetical protein